MGEVYGMHTTTSGKIRYYDTETGEHTYDPNPHFTEPVDSYVSDMWKYNPIGLAFAFESDGTGGKAKSETTNPPKMTGWICPVCGRGLSPYTSFCPCKGFVQGEWKITC